jgi:asparagine synthase (glutamine-hydrolysing)
MIKFCRLTNFQRTLIIMCGFIGSNFHNPEQITIALAKIKSRGPDSTGIQSVGDFTIGSNRLAIQDLSPLANQPMSFDNTYIVYNGELWNNNNDLDKIKVLKNKYEFKTSSDTEVLLKGFKEYRAEIFSIIDGIFGTAIIDGAEVFLARDWIGEIPVYYYFKDGNFIFASEIKAIKEILDVPTKEIKLLNPGTYIHFKDKNIEIHTYYTLNETPVTDDKNIIISKFRSLLEVAVEKRIPDVPYTVLMSGGIDSSIIAYLLKQYNPNLEAFTICLGNNSKKVKNNDLYFARIAAEHLGIKLNEIYITEEEVLKYLDETVYTIEDSSWTQVSSGVPHILMAREIQKYGYKVVFSGSGVDEICASYPMIKRFQWLDHQYDKARKNLIKNIHKNNVIRENKCMLKYSQEIRSPYLDKEFVEYALNIPIEYRFENSKMKPILRYAFEDVLPKEVAWREKITEGLGCGIEQIIKDNKDNIKKIYEKYY